MAAFLGYGASQVFIPTVTKSIQQPDTMAEGIESLAGCVFVQEVEAPALAVLIPVLVRGLNFDKVDVKRKCCIIIENMCKLVEKPREVRPLMPKVKPLPRKAIGARFSPTNLSVERTMRSAPPLSRRHLPMMAAIAIRIPIFPQVAPKPLAIRLPIGISANFCAASSVLPVSFA